MLVFPKGSGAEDALSIYDSQITSTPIYARHQKREVVKALASLLRNIDTDLDMA